MISCFCFTAQPLLLPIRKPFHAAGLACTSVNTQSCWTQTTGPVSLVSVMFPFPSVRIGALLLSGFCSQNILQRQVSLKKYLFINKTWATGLKTKEFKMQSTLPINQADLRNDPSYGKVFWEGRTFFLFYSMAVPPPSVFPMKKLEIWRVMEGGGSCQHFHQLGR